MWERIKAVIGSVTEDKDFIRLVVGYVIFLILFLMLTEG